MAEKVEKVFDPLDYDNLAKSVVTALLESKPEPLPPEEGFGGAGVYAIYYRGSFPPYKPIIQPAYCKPSTPNTNHCPNCDPGRKDE